MIQIKKVFSLIIIVTILSSCAFKKKKELPSTSQNKSCQTLLSDLPKYKEQGALDKVGRITKSGLHYLAVGSGAIADVVIIFSAGIAVGLTVCSPALMADSYAGGNSNMAGACVEAFLREANLPKLYKFPITKYVDGKTYHLTCPNLTVFEEKLREVLKCRDESLSQSEIEWQLRKILSAQDLKKCLPDVGSLQS